MADQEPDWLKPEKAEEALKAKIRAHRFWNGRSDVLSENHLVALHTLHEDMGHFEDNGYRYALEEPIRDRLLAHARQDSAHSLLNTIFLVKRIRWLTVLAGMQLVALFILLLVVLS